MEETQLSVDEYLANYSVCPDLNDKVFTNHLINYIFCAKQIAPSTINFNELTEQVLQQIIKDKKILDVGCGEGFGSHFFSMLGANVVGIDLHEGIITYANEKYSKKNCTFQVMDVTNLSFQDNSFDIVIGMDILEHIEKPEKLINELTRVSKPKAKIFLLTPNYIKHAFLRGGIYPFHVREYTTDTIVEFCGEHFSNYAILSKNIGHIEKIGKDINGRSLTFIIAQKLKLFIKNIIPIKVLDFIKSNRIKNQKISLSDILNTTLFQSDIFKHELNQTASDFMIISEK
jgi:ubiquinone biosynthesis O-methyltransferase